MIDYTITLLLFYVVCHQISSFYDELSSKGDW